MPSPKVSYYSFDSLGNPWVSGGGAVRDFEVLKRFARNTEVTLYAARFPGFQEGVREGVRVRGLGFGGRNWLARLTYSLSANLRILFDRAGLIGNSASIYAPVLSGLLRPGSFYAVYHHYVGKRSLEKFGLIGWIPRALEAVMLRFGRRYVISNATLAAQVQRLNPRARVFTTFNGFDAGLLDQPRAPAAPPFALFVGRFDVYMKGLDLLIPAFAETLAARGCSLVLAGRASPADLARVRALIPENLRESVRLELGVSDARKAELLSTCLFFASPSRFEGFGIAALEANAAGKAVLATDTDGFRDSLALGETALAVPVEDGAALRAGLASLFDDEALRERLGLRGRERARAFSWDAIADKEWTWLRGDAPARGYYTAVVPPLSGVGRVSAALRKGLEERDDIARYTFDSRAGALTLNGKALVRGFTRLGKNAFYLSFLGRVPAARKSFLDNQNLAFLRLPNCGLCVYDLFYLTHPDSLADRILGSLLYRGIGKYPYYLAISQYTKDILCETFGVAPEKVHVIPLDCDRELFRVLPEPGREVFAKLGLPSDRRVLLHVSSGDRRKNYARVLEAFGRIAPRFPDAVLVRVGKPLHKASKRREDALVERLGLGGKVIHVQGVSDPDLARLYNVAEAFVFPSLAEGFGLPVLEAQACGCPCVTSRTTALGEVAGPLCETVDPEDAASIAAGIEAVLQDPGRRAREAEANREFLKRFDWEPARALLRAWMR